MKNEAQVVQQSEPPTGEIIPYSEGFQRMKIPLIYEKWDMESQAPGFDFSYFGQLYLNKMVANETACVKVARHSVLRANPSHFCQPLALTPRRWNEAQHYLQSRKSINKSLEPTLG